MLSRLVDMVQKFAGISLERTIVMGVLNLSGETFYRDSLVKTAEEAAARAEVMVENGAQIIDIGGMSTGPSAKKISLKKEKKLLMPAVETVIERTNVPISVDTQRAEMAEEVLKLGVDVINDISGLKADTEMPKVVSDHGCYAILMANRIRDRIRTAEKSGKDISTMKKVKEGLRESLQICRDHGINLDKISIDPGIGFGRDAEGDIRIIANLVDLSELERPTCIGVSRKSFIGKTLDLDEPRDRLPASLGVTALAFIESSIDIVRTHDPRETSQLIRMIEAVQKMKEG